MNDIVFHGGPIYTLDRARPVAEALLVRGERILAAGSAADVRMAAEPGYEAVPLRGRAVIPGLADAHIHLLWTGEGLRQVDLDGAASLDEALGKVRRHAEQLPHDAWVRGQGWNHALWGYRWPSAQQLDRVTGGRPAILSRKDRHSSWVNTRALELAGIDGRSPDPDGGTIVRDEQGQPTGILLERASELVFAVLPQSDEDEARLAVRDVIAACNARGVTSIHAPDEPAAFGAVQQLRERGELKARYLYHLPFRQLDEYIAHGVRSGLGDEWVRIGSVKIFSDGALGSRTCRMLAPFRGYNDSGMAMLPDEALFEAVLRAKLHGIAVAIHAIGDAANRAALDAIAAARSELRRRGITPPALPDRIEHAQHLDAADVGRFGRLGVVASMQPIHATADREMAERLLGPERAALSYAWRPIAAGGADLAFGSDAPVETLDPWAGIHAAVTRQGQDGAPHGGWHPELSLTLQAALEAYTVGPAVASGEAALKGRLAPGMLADLAVLAQDPFKLEPGELGRIEVESTWVGGRDVYRKV